MRISDWSSDVCSSDLYERVQADAFEQRDLRVDRGLDCRDVHRNGPISRVGARCEPGETFGSVGLHCGSASTGGKLQPVVIGALEAEKGIEPEFGAEELK